MTSIGMTHDRGRNAVRAAGTGSTVRRVMLACGVLSSLLYVATDILGGLRYPGYSFANQAISELVAVGAPSKAFVESLFIGYDVLALAFVAGVLWEVAGRNRAARIMGASMLGFVLLGWIGFASAPIDQRGVGSVDAGLLHAAVAAGVVLLQLVMIGFGAFALGKRFRVYSFATLATVLVLSIVTFAFVPRIAANQSTPGLGVYERIVVYAPMAWLAVLAVAFMRSPRARDAGVAARPSAEVHGTVAPGFEEVRAEFERNFAERGEIGAAVAAYWHGEKVVDLWGGRRAPDDDAPWEEDTMVVVMSTTKGMAAMTLAVANARGWIDYDAPVARYWPEFAQNGKGATTVRQLLGHEAGLVVLDEDVTIDELRDLDAVARLLARQKPAWPAGTRRGYQAMTLGFYMQELIRRVDPAHRTLGRFFHDEIAGPLGLEFYIGLPREIPDRRVARFKPLSPRRAMMAVTHSTPELIPRVIWPWSLLRKSLAIPSGLDLNQRRWLEVELPAGNGVGTARAIARAYSAVAEGGAELGITPETFARVIAPPPGTPMKDAVLGVPSWFSLGFLRPGPEMAFGSSEHAFGAPGAGGSFAFADPDAHLGYAYVMNKLDFYLVDDPREKPLRDAVYRAMARLGGGAAAPHDRAGAGEPVGV